MRPSGVFTPFHGSRASWQNARQISCHQHHHRYYKHDKDYPFAAFATVHGRYNEGKLVGERVKFPTSVGDPRPGKRFSLFGQEIRKSQNPQAGTRLTTVSYPMFSPLSILQSKQGVFCRFRRIFSKNVAPIHNFSLNTLPDALRFFGYSYIIYHVEYYPC